MSGIPKAILDTSALISLYNLDFLNDLRLVYAEVRIPREVQREFLDKISEIEKSKRFDFILNFYKENESWFLPCSEYGEDLISIYLTEEGMDRGESEVLAQNQALDSLYQVIIDEKIAKQIAKNKSFKVHGVLSIIAELCIRFQRKDYFECTEYLIEKQNFNISQKIIKLVYEQKIKEIFG